jgi:hypothetical protein
MTNAAVFLFLVFFSSLSLLEGAVQMDVFPSEMRCVGQELDEEDMALFALSAASVHRKDGQKQVLLATITDPEGGTIISNEKIAIGARPREIKETIKVRGVYELCFELQGGTTPVRAFFHIDFKSRNAPGGLESVRKVGKDDIPYLEQHLKAAETSMNDISREIEFARQQELSLKETQDTTAARIQWFGILSMAILMGTSLYQLIYLRRFFASKKLL